MSGLKSVIRKLANSTIIFIAIYVALMLLAPYAHNHFPNARYSIPWSIAFLCLPVAAGYRNANLPAILLASAFFIFFIPAKDDMSSFRMIAKRLFTIMAKDPTECPYIVIQTSIAYYFGRFFAVFIDLARATMGKQFFQAALRANRGRFAAIILTCLFFLALSWIAQQFYSV